MLSLCLLRYDPSTKSSFPPYDEGRYVYNAAFYSGKPAEVVIIYDILPSPAYVRESTKFVSFVKDMKKSKIEHQNRLRNSKREKH